MYTTFKETGSAKKQVIQVVLRSELPVATFPCAFCAGTLYLSRRPFLFLSLVSQELGLHWYNDKATGERSRVRIPAWTDFSSPKFSD
jgi:hypothetical protein